MAPPTPTFENPFLAGLLIVAIILGLIFACAAVIGIFRSVGENLPKFTADILGREGLAHDFINPRGFVYFEDRVYPARAIDKYIKQGERVIIIAYEGDVLVVRPKTAMDE